MPEILESYNVTNVPGHRLNSKNLGKRLSNYPDSTANHCLNLVECYEGGRLGAPAAQVFDLLTGISIEQAAGLRPELSSLCCEDFQIPYQTGEISVRDITLTTIKMMCGFDATEYYSRMADEHRQKMDQFLLMTAGYDLEARKQGFPTNTKVEIHLNVPANTRPTSVRIGNRIGSKRTGLYAEIEYDLKGYFAYTLWFNPESDIDPELFDLKSFFAEFKTRFDKPFLEKEGKGVREIESWYDPFERLGNMELFGDMPNFTVSYKNNRGWFNVRGVMGRPTNDIHTISTSSKWPIDLPFPNIDLEMILKAFRKVQEMK